MLRNSRLAAARPHVYSLGLQDYALQRSAMCRVKTWGSSGARKEYLLRAINIWSLRDQDSFDPSGTKTHLIPPGPNFSATDCYPREL